MPILQWLDRPTSLRRAAFVPYRLLEEECSLSFGDKDTSNMLIEGDNLAALKALQPFFAGRVKCVYIDPPFNTRQAFEHYQDSLEHNQWLDMIYPRLELLRDLLSEEGSIWVTIDDNEAHYLKVIMDEIFSKAIEWQGGGGFRFYKLGEALFDENGMINPNVTFGALAAFIWFKNTLTPYQGQADCPLLGIHDGIAYYLANSTRLGPRAMEAANITLRPLPWSLSGWQ